MRRRVHCGQCAKQFPGERLRKRFSTTNMDRSSMRFDRSTKHRIQFGVAIDDDDRTRIWRIRSDLLRNHRVSRHRCFALIFGAICRLDLIIAKFRPLPQSAASNTSDFIKPIFFCIVTLRMIFGSDDPRSKRNSLRFQTSDHCASQRSCIEHAQQDHTRDIWRLTCNHPLLNQSTIPIQSTKRSTITDRLHFALRNIHKFLQRLPPPLRAGRIGNDRQLRNVFRRTIRVRRLIDNRLQLLHKRQPRLWILRKTARREQLCCVWRKSSKRLFVSDQPI